MSVESWLWNPGGGALAVESCLRNAGSGVPAVESWKEVQPSCSVGLLLRAALLAAKNCVTRLRILFWPCAVRATLPGLLRC